MIVECTIIPIFMSCYIVNCLACRTKFKVIKILIFYITTNVWISGKEHVGLKVLSVSVLICEYSNLSKSD